MLENSSPLLNIYTLPIRTRVADSRIDSFSPSVLPQEISSCWVASTAITLSGNSRGTSDPRGKEVFDWIISLDRCPLNEPDTLLFFTVPLAAASLLTCSLLTILFFPSHGLQDLGSDHLVILLTISLSPLYHPNEHPLSISRKLNGMTLLFTSIRTSFC